MTCYTCTRLIEKVVLLVGAVVVHEEKLAEVKFQINAVRLNDKVMTMRAIWGVYFFGYSTLTILDNVDM